MDTIQLQYLSTEVSHLIRASSIFPTFSSVVEEIIYNSLDATATNIEIGINKESFEINVKDNGLGITSNILRHGLGQQILTTKDRQNDQLHGYRGESLLAISHLSTIILTSKHYDSTHTYQKIITSEESHLSTLCTSLFTHSGTIMTIKHLFSRLPVRQKSIKIEYEITKIKCFIRKLALLYHHISWTLYTYSSASPSYNSTTTAFISTSTNTTQKKYRSHIEYISQTSVLSRFKEICNMNLTPYVTKMSYSFNGYEIKGLISLPSYLSCYHTKKYQFLYIHNKPMSSNYHLYSEINRIYTSLIQYLLSSSSSTNTMDNDVTTMTTTTTTATANNMPTSTISNMNKGIYMSGNNQQRAVHYSMNQEDIIRHQIYPYFILQITTSSTTTTTLPTTTTTPSSSVQSARNKSKVAVDPLIDIKYDRQISHQNSYTNSIVSSSTTTSASNNTYNISSSGGNNMYNNSYYDSSPIFSHLQDVRTCLYYFIYQVIEKYQPMLIPIYDSFWHDIYGYLPNESHSTKNTRNTQSADMIIQGEYDPYSVTTKDSMIISTNSLSTPMISHHTMSSFTATTATTTTAAANTNTITVKPIQHIDLSQYYHSQDDSKNNDDVDVDNPALSYESIDNIVTRTTAATYTDMSHTTNDGDHIHVYDDNDRVFQSPNQSIRLSYQSADSNTTLNHTTTTNAYKSPNPTIRLRSKLTPKSTTPTPSSTTTHLYKDAIESFRAYRKSMKQQQQQQQGQPSVELDKIYDRTIQVDHNDDNKDEDNEVEDEREQIGDYNHSNIIKTFEGSNTNTLKDRNIHLDIVYDNEKSRSEKNIWLSPPYKRVKVSRDTSLCDYYDELLSPINHIDESDDINNISHDIHINCPSTPSPPPPPLYQLKNTVSRQVRNPQLSKYEPIIQSSSLGIEQYKLYDDSENTNTDIAMTSDMNINMDINRDIDIDIDMVVNGNMDNSSCISTCTINDISHDNNIIGTLSYRHQLPSKDTNLSYVDVDVTRNYLLNRYENNEDIKSQELDNNNNNNYNNNDDNDKRSVIENESYYVIKDDNLIDFDDDFHIIPVLDKTEHMINIQYNHQYSGNNNNNKVETNNRDTLMQTSLFLSSYFESFDTNQNTLLNSSTYNQYTNKHIYQVDTSIFNNMKYIGAMDKKFIFLSVPRLIPSSSSSHTAPTNTTTSNTTTTTTSTNHSTTMVDSAQNSSLLLVPSPVAPAPTAAIVVVDQYNIYEEEIVVLDPHAADERCLLDTYSHQDCICRSICMYCFSRINNDPTTCTSSSYIMTSNISPDTTTTTTTDNFITTDEMADSSVLLNEEGKSSSSLAAAAESSKVPNIYSSQSTYPNIMNSTSNNLNESPISKNIHSFISPIIHSINELEYSLLTDYQEVFNKWGFSYTLTHQASNSNSNSNSKNDYNSSGKGSGSNIQNEDEGMDRGGDISIILNLNTSPIILNEILQLGDFIEFINFLSDHLYLPSFLWKPPSITRIYNSKACRNAIKFGDIISENTCLTLIKKLQQTQLPFQCAHGRPTVYPLNIRVPPKEQTDRSLNLANSLFTPYSSDCNQHIYDIESIDLYLDILLHI